MIYKWKVCVLGDAAVGKTSLVRHYCEGYFRENYLSTIGVSFLRKNLDINVDGQKHGVVLQLWDLGGQTIFSTVRANYLKGTSGALILFDLTEKITLSHVTNWYNDVKRTAGDIPILVIGNKMDLDYNKNVVNRAEKLCRDLGVELYLTSAKTGDHMNKVFEQISIKMINENANTNKHIEVEKFGR